MTDLLSRLDKVRSRGGGRYEACCPAHNDSSPSLSIYIKDDGRILLHCWAGCAVDDVVGAIGLAMGDLFPDTDKTLYKSIEGRPRWAMKDVPVERYELAILESKRGRGERLTDDEKKLYVNLKRRLAA